MRARDPSGLAWCSGTGPPEEALQHSGEDVLRPRTTPAPSPEEADRNLVDEDQGNLIAHDHLTYPPTITPTNEGMMYAKRHNVLSPAHGGVRVEPTKEAPSGRYRPAHAVAEGTPSPRLATLGAPEGLSMGHPRDSVCGAPKGSSTGGKGGTNGPLRVPLEGSRQAADGLPGPGYTWETPCAETGLLANAIACAEILTLKPPLPQPLACTLGEPQTCSDTPPHTPP